MSPIGTSGRSKLVRRRVSQVAAGASQIQWNMEEPIAGSFCAFRQAVVLKAFAPEEKVGLSQSVCGGYFACCQDGCLQEIRALQKLKDHPNALDLAETPVPAGLNFRAASTLSLQISSNIYVT